MAKFAIAAKMLVIFLSFNGFLSSSSLILPEELQKHKISYSGGEGRYRTMLLRSCKGENACIERGLRFLSLRKKQPPMPPAPARNPKKINGVVHVSDPPLSPLMKRIKAFLYGSPPPSASPP